jgi:hypothetical protein
VRQAVAVVQVKTMAQQLEGLVAQVVAVMATKAQTRFKEVLVPLMVRVAVVVRLTTITPYEVATTALRAYVL